MYKDKLCSNQIIFTLLKISQNVHIESEIAFLIRDYKLKIKVKTKNQNFKSHYSSRQLEKNFKTFCSVDMLNLFLVFLYWSIVFWIKKKFKNLHLAHPWPRKSLENNKKWQTYEKCLVRAELILGPGPIALNAGREINV
jgi:hypothetical protein